MKDKERKGRKKQQKIGIRRITNDRQHKKQINELDLQHGTPSANVTSETFAGTCTGLFLRNFYLINF